MIPIQLRVLFACPMALAFPSHPAAAQRVFGVKDYGATGRTGDDVRPAIQKAIDSCGKVGGGEVYVPSGEYTSGQLHLRSGVRLNLEAGAIFYATLDGSQDDDSKKAALIYGEDLHDIALEDRGTLDHRNYRPDAEPVANQVTHFDPFDLRYFLFRRLLSFTLPLCL